jgi:hypothetical protein
MMDEQDVEAIKMAASDFGPTAVIRVLRQWLDEEISKAKTVNKETKLWLEQKKVLDKAYADLMSLKQVTR